MAMATPNLADAEMGEREFIHVVMGSTDGQHIGKRKMDDMA